MVGKASGHRVFQLGALYLNRLASSLVGLFFLPAYLHLLGPEAFAIVAVITSLQALAILLDLGLATVVGRDLAVFDTTAAEAKKILDAAEASLICLYVCISLVVIGFVFIFKASFEDTIQWLGTPLILLVAVLQNLHYSALTSRKQFFAAGLINTFGILMKAIATWVTLKLTAATIENFIAAQLAFGIFHLFAMRMYSKRVFYSAAESPKREIGASLSDCLKLITKARGLLLSSVAGAIATQLDKPILSAYVPTQDLSAYFLAHTLSSAPLLIIATPIVQYFQPLITNSCTEGSNRATQILLGKLGLAMFIATMPAVLFITLKMDWVTSIWLNHSPLSTSVSEHSYILLAAYTIGCVGYVPYTLIIAKQGYRFNAFLSVFSTLIMAGFIAAASYYSNTKVACYAYIAYYAVVTTGFSLWALKKN